MVLRIGTEIGLYLTVCIKGHVLINMNIFLFGTFYTPCIPDTSKSISPMAFKSRYYGGHLQNIGCVSNFGDLHIECEQVGRKHLFLLKLIL